MTTLFTGALGTQTATSTEVTDYLAELVGPGKKFETVADLAKGKWMSDNEFIPQLKLELEEVRKDLKTRTSLEEAIAKITAPQAQSSNLGATASGQSNAGEIAQATGLTLAQAEALFDQKLTQTQRSIFEADNFRIVQSEVDKHWGAEADVRLRNKARELGLSTTEVDGIAKSNPKAFLAMFGLATTQASSAVQNVTPPRSHTSTTSSSATTGTRNKAYWDKMRQTDNGAYHSREMTVLRHKAALELGDAFFS